MGTAHRPASVATLQLTSVRRKRRKRASGFLFVSTLDAALCYWRRLYGRFERGVPDVLDAPELTIDVRTYDLADGGEDAARRVAGGVRGALEASRAVA